MAKAHTFKPGEALTAEKMNTLLQDNQIIQDYDSDSDIPEDYILSAKGVKDPNGWHYNLNYSDRPVVWGYKPENQE